MNKSSIFKILNLFEIELSILIIIKYIIRL
jgi:hypothetical protein